MVPGQSAILEHWFNLDIEWVEENFIIWKPQFYNRLFQSNIEGQSEKNPTFPAPIGNSKEKGEMKYHPKDPQLEYNENA